MINSTQLKKLQMLKQAEIHPALALFNMLDLLRQEMKVIIEDKLSTLQRETIANAVVDAVDSLKGVRGKDGVNGKDGYTPVKGKDYFTKDEREQFIRQSTPRKGIDYLTDQEIGNLYNFLASQLPIPENGKTPVKGVDYLTEADIESIASKIREYLPENKEKTDEDIINIFTKKGKKLSMKHIDGLEQTISAFSNQLGRGYLHGGGVPSLAAGSGITLTKTSDGGYIITTSASGSVVTMTGTIDDSNVTFTCTTQPTEMVINGVSYLSTGGAITWSYLAGTITLSTPVGVNGTIWGRV